ncbi:MAG: tRNA pseudouridine(38-40) synthase TruA [Rhodospirillales bacterium]|nr:tRNA pseudouridine(38-40) synthase TruA [Rhodospirillales bacterium]MBO6787923.1 tRNA pseudouridine(38-40) synthase TruA [Rhodospirillales bacterium]
MPRFKLTIEYDGNPFRGWQRQDNGPSVQETLENAVFALTGENSLVQGAGRTDSGVHALAQVAHVDISKEFPADTVRDALNHHVRPHPVSVLAVEAVDENFHARFSATGRAYLYRILNRRAPPALDEGRVWWQAMPLDAQTMHAGAQELIGHHDFTSFRASECQAKSPEKTLDRLEVSLAGDEIHIIAEARSFLHHQVRNFVGTLQLVGSGKWRPTDVAKALKARDRSAGGPTAPAQGLYLTRVDYAEE